MTAVDVRLRPLRAYENALQYSSILFTYQNTLNKPTCDASSHPSPWARFPDGTFKKLEHDAVDDDTTDCK